MSIRRSRPTLHDVAKAAGVGTTTVSRVINGGHYVAPPMLARIQRVMKELGYQPSVAARSLKSSRSRSIGLIVPSITDPFFAQFAAVAEQHARLKEHVLLLLTCQDNAELQVAAVETLERHRVDGLLLAPPRSNPKALLHSLHRLSVPIVAFDRPIAGREFSSVVSDNQAAAQEAVRHLMKHKRKRILCLGGDPRLYTIKERMKGATKALAAAGLDAILEMNTSDYPTAEAVILKHMASRGKVDGIFGLYNQTSMLAYEVMQNHGIKIGERVSLIGFDDFSVAATLRPSITAVRQPTEELAHTATQLLLNQMEGRATAPQQIEVASSLIIRQSCGCNTAG